MTLTISDRKAPARPDVAHHPQEEPVTDPIRQAEQAANHVKVSPDARAIALALLAIAEAVREAEVGPDGQVTTRVRALGQLGADIPADPSGPTPTYYGSAWSCHRHLMTQPMGHPCSGCLADSVGRTTGV